MSKRYVRDMSTKHSSHKSLYGIITSEILHIVVYN